MAKDRLRSAAAGGGGGDGSDGDSSASLEEISADDFKNPNPRIAKDPTARSNVWMSYPMSRNYGTSLYSFAWAQAVQNKPLGLDLKEDEDVEEEEEMEVVVDCDEKEEGELEEGEIGLGLGLGSATENQKEQSVIVNETIDLDSDAPPEKESEESKEEEKESDEIGDFDQRVASILEELENVTIEETEKSFEGACSRLKTSFESLKQLFTEMGSLPMLEALIQQAFVGIKTIISVLDSDNLQRREQNKLFLLRVLVHIKNQYASMLSPEQLEELESDVKSLAFKDSSNPEVQNASSKLVPVPVSSTKKPNLPKLDITRNRTLTSPLLNLHVDYDENTLPSPTRDNPLPLPIPPPVNFTQTLKPNLNPNKNLPEVKNSSTSTTTSSTLHPYITDAFKAVSSYQQRYGKNSVFATDDLPSPTPSEEERSNKTNGETTGEVSSSLSSLNNIASTSTISSATAATPLIQQAGQKPGPKSRDPRLRFINPETSGGSATLDPNPNPSLSRKNKAVDGPAIEQSMGKRQRNGRGGWLEETIDNSNSRSTQPSANPYPIPNPSPNPNPVGPTVSTLPSLLKDIAVNPTMLVQLLQMKSSVLSGNSTAGQTTAAVTTTAAAAPAATTAVSSQNEAGRIRMKPRDPRRILHSNITQKSDINNNNNNIKNTSNNNIINNSTINIINNNVNNNNTVGPEPEKPNGPNLTERQTIREQGEQAQMSQTNGQKFPLSDMAMTPGQVGDAWGDVDHLLDGYDEEQRAAIQRERARRIAEQNKMFAARKLCLVLDLDHTLLNSAKFVEVDPVHEEILRKKEEQDREKPQRHLFRFQHMGMWTKLRPGIWNFLEKASKLYELHLYTMGNKLYATEMAKVLDPTGNLFAGRVISRGDDSDPLDGDERVPKSKDLEGVLGMESAVVIIDDSVRVWPHNKHNLIVVERYTYFPCSRRQFGLLGPSLLEIDRDERPEDGTLASSLAVIERIHGIFYAHRSLNEADVRNILAGEQRKILSGCKIVFSRIFPVGEANPHLHPLWQTAEQFGAQCTNQIDESVTHVVAHSLGTDKVNWALSTGRFVVHPGWVEASALLYRRANELDFTVMKI